MAITNMWQDDS